MFQGVFLTFLLQFGCLTAGKADDTVSALPFLKDMRIEVNLRNRELYVIGESGITVYPVAVGRPEWPTRTGSWYIYQVVWNPWWHPPDESWAWNRAIMAPGDPDNPMGRAQLIYDPPRSIHGTNEPLSIGKAVSHGSIRVSNETAMLLARKIMEVNGIICGEEWYDDVRSNRSKNVKINLPNPIPIRVYQEY
ncbi:MAG: L,D-transpeptidase [Balneolales bacterium]